MNPVTHIKEIILKFVTSNATKFGKICEIEPTVAYFYWSLPCFFFSKTKIISLMVFHFAIKSIPWRYSGQEILPFKCLTRHYHDCQKKKPLTEQTWLHFFGFGSFLGRHSDDWCLVSTSRRTHISWAFEE